MRMILLAFILCCLGFDGWATPVKKQHIEVELLSEVNTVIPRDPFWIAFRMKPDRNWHTYWHNPGDAGLPPKFKWRFPKGFQIIQSKWPFPQLIQTDSITTYGYLEETLILFQIRPPAILPVSNRLAIQTLVSWAVCREVCIAEKTELSVSLPVKTSPHVHNSEWESTFRKARDRLPQNATNWKATFYIKEKQVHLLIDVPSKNRQSKPQVYLFPVQAEVLDHSSGQNYTWNKKNLSIIQKTSEYLVKAPQILQGVLLFKSGKKQQAFNIAASYVAGFNP